MSLDKSHKFWDTQPVPKETEKVSDFGPIENKTVDQVQKEPYPLPSAYEWFEIDVNSDADMQDLYDLLEKNYVEDDEAMFRFAYPVEFLRWALTPPEWKKIWHLSVRVRQTQKLVAFISGIPANIKVKDKNVQMVEINFLCVHKQLREKRLAPLLIKEITRRVNLTNIWQAVYTAGIQIPKPFCTTRYNHRTLNPEKLVNIGFTRIPKKFENFKNPMKMTEKLYKLPDQPQIPGFRPMKQKDIPQAYELLKKYLTKFELHPQFTKDEFAHWFGTRNGVIYSYVVEDPEKKTITNFASFYSLPSSIINNVKYDKLNAAYLFYYAYSSVSLQDLMQDLLVSAKKLDFDVFNCLDIMENSTFLAELKFGLGDGNLFYYLYNFKCPELKPKTLGLTML